MISRIVTDLIILAIDTLQVAVGKKDVAYPTRTTDNGFFSMMKTDGGNAEASPGFAISQRFRESVGMTIPWTKSAIVEGFQFRQQRGKIGFFDRFSVHSQARLKPQIQRHKEQRYRFQEDGYHPLYTPDMGLEWNIARRCLVMRGGDEHPVE